ncbi:MAG: nucleotidyltransferase domain-containing protein [Spirochaetales bacterium]|nr:nucleotidyltransferase domain-containing protein [Spirochaetales bacterium]
MDEALLTQAAKIIRSQYHNARILLFGSTARYDDTEDSDVDLCIILDHPAERPLDISRRIRKELYPVIKKPIDILVYDKEVFHARAAVSVSLEAELAEEGREI